MDLIINLNKPKDITSHDAVSKVKKILKAKKVGHTGTLDPMATGVMLICVNRATRLASYFSDLEKEYRAVMKLGETTDSQDAYGQVISKSDKVEIDQRAVEDVMNSFKGNILQHPPMFSALKHKGTPLYKLARQGIEVERKARAVYIYNIELLDFDFPFVGFRTVCSKGTYIRTLCHDMGEKLGMGAHLFELERTAVGHFHINDSVTIEELQDADNVLSTLGGTCSMGEALSWLPEIKIQASSVRSIKNGAPLKAGACPDFTDGMKKAKGIRITSRDDDLLAVASYSPDRDLIKMDVVFADS